MTTLKARVIEAEKKLRETTKKLPGRAHDATAGKPNWNKGWGKYGKT